MNARRLLVLAAFGIVIAGCDQAPTGVEVAPAGARFDGGLYGSGNRGADTTSTQTTTEGTTGSDTTSGGSGILYGSGN